MQQAKKEGGNFRAEMKNDVSGTLIDETEVLSVLFRQVTMIHRHKRIHRLLIGLACRPCFG